MGGGGVTTYFHNGPVGRPRRALLIQTTQFSSVEIQPWYRQCVSKVCAGDIQNINKVR